MKIRTDIVRMYKDIHGWVGIISGLALFIAFYAGAITMFEEPLQRWASPPSRLSPPTSLERTPELIAKVVAAHPEAAKGYDVHLETSSAVPGRVSWQVHDGADEHGDGKLFWASLAPDGSLQVERQGPSPVAQFVDVLHQQVGLPFEHEVAMPIMGAVALLYVVALVSGVIVLLPSLVSDLFALRMGKNVKRMWLDVHNVLGVFSLPFHVVMALTAVVFAFHDQFYDAQALAFPKAEVAAPRAASPPPRSPALAPKEVVVRIGAQAPGFRLRTLTYGRAKDGRVTLRVAGEDPRYGLRAPNWGIAGVDPFSGKIVMRDYMPGLQDGWGATITSFFALHFGNFGGAGVRWAYFLLGLAGAFLFYTGNLLWIESRRKRERKAGAVEQTRSTKILGSLTVAVPLGCIAGVSTTLAAAKFLGASATAHVHSAIYYSVFVLFVGWGLWRGPARSGAELPIFAAFACSTVLIASLYAGFGWYEASSGLLIDALSVVLSGILLFVRANTVRRSVDGARDSIWSAKVTAS